MSQELQAKFNLQIKKSNLQGKKCKLKNWQPSHGIVLKGELTIVCEQILHGGVAGVRVTNELLKNSPLGSSPVALSEIEFI